MVTLIPADLTQPAGDLEASFFPDDNLDDLLSGWLTDATTRVEGADPAIAIERHNNAAAAWVYYRAYSYIANRLASMPDSMQLLDYQASINKERVAYWEALAAAQLAVYEELAIPPVLPTPRPVSTHTRTLVSW